VDSVIPVLNNYVDLNSLQTITANKTFSGKIIMSDGGTNSSSIDQVGQQLNITNAMYNNNITTITGLILSTNTTKLIRTDSVIMPTVLGNITGDNINSLVTNNLFISTVATGGMYISSNYPAMGLDFVIVATTYPIGTMITSNIGTYFSVGTYVIANSPVGYVQFNKPLLAAIVKITVSTALITLNKGIIGGALLGNVYIDYRPTTNIQINTASTVTQNAISINPSSMILGMPTSTPYEPLLANDLVNKAYADAILTNGASGNIGGIYIGANTDITGQSEIRLYNGIWMDTLNANFMRFYNNSVSTAGFGFYCGSTVSQILNLSLGGVNILNTCLYGRNDAFAFNVASTVGVTNGLYPVGYTWEILGVLSTPVTGSNYVGVVASPALGKGVWAISGYLVINKGTAAYLAASTVNILWDTVAGIRIYPASSGLQFPLLAASTYSKYVIPLGTINVVVTTAGAIQTINRMISCTIGTLTWQVSFSGVKIA
jgi:hypothetical protein